MESTPNTSGPGLKPQKRRESLRKAILGTAILLAVCLIGVIGLFIYYYTSSPTARDVTVSLLSRDYSPDRAFPNQNEVNVLLMGRDLDRDRQGRIIHTRGRTDTMMIAHFDFRNRSASILSIPRDTLVHIPGYRGRRRISYANAYGGSELAEKTMEEFLGLRPDYHVLLNFQAFEKAIDCIGGLEATVDKQLDYDDNWGNLHIHLKPGRQTLNGNQAMGFVRYRQSKDGDAESDFVRIGRQQELLRAAREKLSSAGAMFKVPKALDIIGNDVDSDLTPAQMLCLAKCLKTLPSDSQIRMETVPVAESGGVFIRPDTNETRKLARQMFFDNQQ